LLCGEIDGRSIPPRKGMLTVSNIPFGRQLSGIASRALIVWYWGGFATVGFWR
tara:strand:+ start:3644 stop:3802 length:159 start_codon:yes stop_codon:yes gene_type:complete